MNLFDRNTVAARIMLIIACDQQKGCICGGKLKSQDVGGAELSCALRCSMLEPVVKKQAKKNRLRAGSFQQSDKQ